VEVRRTLLSPIGLGAAVLGAVVFLLVPVLAADAAPGPSTGLLGVVKQIQGGTCLAGDPCDGIGRGVLLVFSRVGQSDHRVRSDDEGRFKVRLQPGRYRVRAGASATRVLPFAVIVPLKGFARVTITVGSRGAMP
jgi:hypothetical protein